MKDDGTDPKRQAILQAAWQAFATYGYRKTSMDDIARGAGMSRPAVYLHFRGKEEIFRNLVGYYYDTAVADVTAALARSGPPDAVLERAFLAQAGETMEAMLTSPHGLELLDAGAATASDVKDAGETRLAEVYAEWLTREAAAGRVRLGGSAEAVAGTICAALKTIKHGGTDYATAMERLRLLARMIGDGLAA